MEIHNASFHTQESALRRICSVDKNNIHRKQFVLLIYLSILLPIESAGNKPSFSPPQSFDRAERKKNFFFRMNHFSFSPFFFRSLQFSSFVFISAFFFRSLPLSSFIFTSAFFFHIHFRFLLSITSVLFFYSLPLSSFVHFRFLFLFTFRFLLSYSLPFSSFIHFRFHEIK